MADKYEALERKIDSLTKAVEKKQLDVAPRDRGNTAALLNGDAPFVTTGSIAASQPFSVAKAVGLVAGKIRPDQAKVEDEWTGKFQKAIKEQYNFDVSDTRNRLVPFGFDLLPADLAKSSDMRCLKAMMHAAVADYDPDEAAWHQRRFMKADPLSPFVESTGGAMVPPAQMGELITLYRNIEVMNRAGATSVSLPPNGKMYFPRQTGVTSAVWLNEPVNLSSSNGQTNPTWGNGPSLEAKKLGAYVVVNNDVYRFGQSAAIEGMTRQDMARSLALTMDLALLEGSGSPGRPLGLINYPNILSYTAISTGVNGDTLSPEDGYLMAAQVEEQADEAEFEKWLMRPLMKARLGAKRADAVVPGDGQGAWVTDMMRALGAGIPNAWADYPVVKTNQISRARTKGSASNLTYVLGGRFSDYIVGTFGALEFTQADQTNLLQDQTVIRAIMFGDGAPRREKSFIKCDSLAFQG